MKGSFLYSTLAACVVLLGCCLPASAGLNMDEGLWRVELNNDFGVHQGSRDRSGDYSVNAVVEYEIPATPRATLGLRMLPLFVYDQNGGDDYRSFRRIFQEEGEGGGTVWGGGFGIGGRVYQVKDEYRGWYGEATVSTLFHAEKFNGNSSNLNFVTGLGVGYQFKSDWHVQVHYQHISNGSLGDENSGANALGFGIGYRF
jgi:hypothetical protein